jgi:LysR family transcriptional regulator, regulator for genes of the gallate degradation pathway
MSPDNLNLRHLRAFREVVRCGSISAASHSVHLSQPAITQAIAKLEHFMSALLFVRSSTGMTTTEAGALLFMRSERALDLIRAGAQQCRVGNDARRGKGFANFDELVTSAQLRALIAVSDHGNFTLAARGIGASQPSLHRLARDLESLSGVPLFKARHARLAFSELHQSMAEIDATQGINSARIMIGTLPLARSSILPNTINEFAGVRPEVQVGVVDGPYDDLLHALRHGELDLIVGALREPVPIDDVVQEALFHDPLAVVARHLHPLASRTTISVADLACYPWVVPKRGPPTRLHFDALFKDAGIDPPTGLVEASSLVLIRGLLTGSDRLTIVSAHQVEPELRLGALQCLPFDLKHTSRPIGITVRRDWQPTTIQSLFVNLLRKASRQAAETGPFRN